MKLQGDADKQELNATFPGFTAELVQTERGRFFLRRSVNMGAPILLLHGFSQSHMCWSKIAPALSKNHIVICMDLLGYGLSDAPPGDTKHHRCSKKEMAKDCLAVMDSLGIDTFIAMGHDRGALVAMRLALLSDRIRKLILFLDNLPTFLLWDRIAVDPSFITHWREMAAPSSEALLTQKWLESLLRGMTASGTLGSLPNYATVNYRHSWRDPARIHAFCEDYQVGADPDVELDRDDYTNGGTIQIRSLLIWGADFTGKV